MKETIFYILLLSTLPGVFSVAKLNNKIFVDVDAISYIDPTKEGLLVILDEKFIKSYLQENQFPTLFVSAIPVTKSSTNDRVTKVLFPELIQEGKLIALEGLGQKSWYYACVEFESLNRHNESTGCTCRLFRTLDKFGKSADSTVTDVRMTGQRHDALFFELNADSDFQARYTVYLSQGGVPARTVLIKSGAGQKILRISFDNLDPDSDYGSLCVLEEPLSPTPAYTTLGRLIGAFVDNCYLSNLKTKSQPMADATVGQQPEFQRLDGSKIDNSAVVDGATGRNRAMNSASLFWAAFVAVVSIFMQIFCSRA